MFPMQNMRSVQLVLAGVGVNGLKSLSSDHFQMIFYLKDGGQFHHFGTRGESPVGDQFQKKTSGQCLVVGGQ